MTVPFLPDLVPQPQSTLDPALEPQLPPSFLDSVAALVSNNPGPFASARLRSLLKYNPTPADASATAGTPAQMPPAPVSTVRPAPAEGVYGNTYNPMLYGSPRSVANAAYQLAHGTGEATDRMMADPILGRTVGPIIRGQANAIQLVRAAAEQDAIGNHAAAQSLMLRASLSAGVAGLNTGMLALPELGGLGALGGRAADAGMASLPSDFAILTAENPNNTALSLVENRARNTALENELMQRGYEFGGKGPRRIEPVKGVWSPDNGTTLLHENSYIVHGMSPDEAAALGAKHGQASVITRHGLHDLKANTVAPLKSVDYAPHDVPYTERGNGERIGMDFDFDNQIPGVQNAATPDARPSVLAAPQQNTGALGAGNLATHSAEPGITHPLDFSKYARELPPVEPLRARTPGIRTGNNTAINMLGTMTGAGVGALGGGLAGTTPQEHEEGAVLGGLGGAIGSLGLLGHFFPAELDEAAGSAAAQRALKSGRPGLIGYHGTFSDFDVPTPQNGDLGVHWGSSPDQAYERLLVHGDSFRSQGQTPRLITADLNVKPDQIGNIDDIGSFDGPQRLANNIARSNDLPDGYELTDMMGRMWARGLPYEVRMNALREYLENKLGFHAMRYVNEGEIPGATRAYRAMHNLSSPLPMNNPGGQRWLFPADMHEALLHHARNLPRGPSYITWNPDVIASLKSEPVDNGLLNETMARRDRRIQMGLTEAPQSLRGRGPQLGLRLRNRAGAIGLQPMKFSDFRSAEGIPLSNGNFLSFTRNADGNYSAREWGTGDTARPMSLQELDDAYGDDLEKYYGFRPVPKPPAPKRAPIVYKPGTGGKTLHAGLSQADAAAKMKELSAAGTRAQMRRTADGTFEIVTKGEPQPGTKVAKVAKAPVVAPAPGLAGEPVGEAGFQSRLVTALHTNPALSGQAPQSLAKWKEQLLKTPGVNKAEVNATMSSIASRWADGDRPVTPTEMMQLAVEHSPVSSLTRTVLRADPGFGQEEDDDFDPDDFIDRDYLWQQASERAHEDAEERKQDSLVLAHQLLQQAHAQFTAAHGSQASNALMSDLLKHFPEVADEDGELTSRAHAAGYPDEEYENDDYAHPTEGEIDAAVARNTLPVALDETPDSPYYHHQRGRVLVTRAARAMEDGRDLHDRAYRGELDNETQHAFDELYEDEYHTIREDHENNREANDAEGNTEYNQYQRVDPDAAYREILLHQPGLGVRAPHFIQGQDLVAHARGELSGGNYRMIEAQSDAAKKLRHSAGGYEQNELQTTFKPTENWAQLATGASLHQAADEGASTFSFVTPKDRMNRASLDEESANATYGHAVPKALKRIFEHLGIPYEEVSRDADEVRVKLTPEAREKILKYGVPALGAVGAASRLPRPTSGPGLNLQQVLRQLGLDKRTRAGAIN